MKKMLNMLLIVIITISWLFFNFNIKKVEADSGFDTSYNSSSSSSQGDYSDSDGFLSDAGRIIGNVLLFVYTPILLIGVIIDLFDKFNINHSDEIQDDEIKKIIPDFNREKFLKERFNDYVVIQNAWTNFDYDTLRSILTDELYNQYVMQLDTLKMKNQKNIMLDFKYKDAKITQINNVNNQVMVKLEMIVEFFDYIEQDKKIIRGKSNVKVTQHYEMVFVCGMTKLDICPNCGAKLEGNASNKCDYCGSIVSGLSDKWVMSKKESKRQK